MARSRIRLASALFFLLAGLQAGAAVAAGTWAAAPASAINGGPAFGLWLLTDGTVLSHGDALNHWVILTPDKTGSYAGGTWKTVANSNFARGGAQEHVLRDGRFFETGGEYLYAWPAHDGVAACSSSCTNPPSGSPLYKNAEVYDPLSNMWTVLPDAPYDVGDTGGATLPDGRILVSTRVSNATQIFDPTTDTWSTGPAETNANGDEASWATLQNGGVLAVAPTSASIFDPVASSWIKTGALPAGMQVTLTAASGYPGTYYFGDNAGISQMFDGRVLAYGLGTTAIYTPGATASDPGSWKQGPNLPYKQGPYDGTPGNAAEDEYTVTEPNGKVMVPTHPYGKPDDMLVEFDPTTDTFASITPPPDGSNPYPQSFTNLPNGQVMVTGGSRDWLYTPDGSPQDAWRPSVTSVVYDSASQSYTLTGTQLSGLINGGDEGDDMTMAENYPIVWLRDASNDVYFCRSFNFSTMGPQVGTAPQTCQFKAPANLASGSYSLYVSSVGVPSKDPFPFTVGVGGTATGGTSGSAGASGAAGGRAGAAGGAGGGTGTGGSTGGTGGKVGTGGSPGAAGTTGSGGGGPSAGGSTGTGGGSTGAGGGGAGAGGSATGAGSAGKSSGCACAMGPRPASFWTLSSTLLALSLVFTRRRRRPILK